MRKSEIVKKNERALFLTVVLTGILVAGVVLYDSFGSTAFMSIVAALASVTAMAVLILPYLKGMGLKK